VETGDVSLDPEHASEDHQRLPAIECSTTLEMGDERVGARLSDPCDDGLASPGERPDVFAIGGEHVHGVGGQPTERTHRQIEPIRATTSISCS
jgi:hypothetical protein